MPVHLTDFSNDKYEVLKTLYSHQVQIGEDAYVPLSQQEVADIMGYSRPKINQLMKELVDEEYISVYHDKRAKYTITSRGLAVVQVFETLIPPEKQPHR